MLPLLSDQPIRMSDLDTAVENEAREEKKRGRWGKLLHLAYLSTLAVAATAISALTAGSIVGPVLGSSKISSLVGSMGSLVLTGAVALYSIVKRKPLYETFVSFLTTYTAFNLVLSPMVAFANATYPIIGYWGSKIAGSVGAAVAKSAYSMTAFNSLLVAGFKGISYLVQNRFDPRGMLSYIKKDFWPFNNRMSIGYSPVHLAVPNGIRDIFGLPIFLANTLGFVAYNLIRPMKVPYVAPIPQRAMA